jgi:DMSO/TMAO reductase YedYZ heme-binding membrane subunit
MQSFILDHWVHLLPIIPIVLFIFIDLATRKNRKENPTATTGYVVSITLMPYVRRIVYAAAIVWALFLYYLAAAGNSSLTNSLVVLQRYYGLTALTLIYIVLVPGLFRVYFPSFSLNPLLTKSQRAIGLTIFSFALMHIILGFFVNLSGSLSAVLLLPIQNQWALLFGTIAFSIFLLMAATSFDPMVRALGQKRWNMVHRLIYAAAILVVFHAFFIGSHFTDRTSVIPLIVNFVTIFVILLEIGAILKRTIHNKDHISSVRYGLTWMAMGILALCSIYFSFQAITNNVFDPHAEHRVRSDNKYELQLSIPSTAIIPGKKYKMTIKVVDGATGKQVKDFQIVHDKLLHLVVLKSDLTSYQHLHPTREWNGSYTQEISFPSTGVYNFFAEFQPSGGESSLARSSFVTSGGREMPASITTSPLTQNFGEYQVQLLTRELPVGRTVPIVFRILDAKTGKPISDLEPYLSSFGHLVVVNEDSSSYLHVHPSAEVRDERERGGPEVEFLTQFDKPGKYKLYLQFQRNGKIQLGEWGVGVQ